jgi:HSP20 family molecular chaperone IbpA
LPEGLDVDEISATFKKGVLKIEIPKSHKRKTKKVSIKD